ncbi:MAG: polysaccharide deacetylase family protein [Bacteroidota bacterium]
MIRLYRSSSFHKSVYPSLVWKKESKQSIYLTFDDGPTPTVTSWVLDQLKKVEAKATFFCLGKNLSRNPSLAKRMLSEGHLLANHTHVHLDGWLCSDTDYLNDIEKCELELKKLGVNNRLFRPPYGRIKRSQIKKLKHKEIIMWNLLSWDFDSRMNIFRSIRFMQSAVPGSILVFHDHLKSFENLKIMLPELLQHFYSKGFFLERLDHD